MMMMMTGFSAIPQSTTTALRAMPRKTSVDEAEAVGEKDEATEPTTINSTSVNTPPPPLQRVKTWLYPFWQVPVRRWLVVLVQGRAFGNTPRTLVR